MKYGIISLHVDTGSYDTVDEYICYHGILTNEEGNWIFDAFYNPETKDIWVDSLTNTDTDEVDDLSGAYHDYIAKLSLTFIQ